MENASKALLIAAAVLIVILLITFGIRIFNSTSDTSKQAGNLGNQISKSMDNGASISISEISKANLGNNADKDFEWNNGQISAYKGDGGSVIIPDKCTGILEGAFRNCKSITSITIPTSVKNIGKLAFEGCEFRRIDYMGTYTEFTKINKHSWWCANSKISVIKTTDASVAIHSSEIVSYEP